MKIRLGFVSNSSSSSFLFITTDDISEEAMEKMTQKERDILVDVLASSKFLGQNIVELFEVSNYGETYFNGTHIDEFNWESDAVHDAVENWVAIVKGTAPRDMIYEKEESD